MLPPQILPEIIAGCSACDGRSIYTFCGLGIRPNRIGAGQVVAVTEVNKIQLDRRAVDEVVSLHAVP